MPHQIRSLHVAFLFSKVYWETLWEFPDLAELITGAEVVGWWAAEGSLVAYSREEVCDART